MNLKKSKYRISEMIFGKVKVTGLRLVNQSLNTNYRLSKIYYVPVDNPNNSVYEFLIQELIKHLHSGQVFEEV